MIYTSIETLKNIVIIQSCTRTLNIYNSIHTWREINTMKVVISNSNMTIINQDSWTNGGLSPQCNTYWQMWLSHRNLRTGTMRRFSMLIVYTRNDHEIRW